MKKSRFYPLVLGPLLALSAIAASATSPAQPVMAGADAHETISLARQETTLNKQRVEVFGFSLSGRNVPLLLEIGTPVASSHCRLRISQVYIDVQNPEDILVADTENATLPLAVPPRLRNSRTHRTLADFWIPVSAC